MKVNGMVEFPKEVGENEGWGIFIDALESRGLSFGEKEEVTFSSTKELFISYEGQKYKVTFKDTPENKETKVFDEKGILSSKSAIEVLRAELARIGLEEKGNTNQTFREIWKYHNPKR